MNIGMSNSVEEITLSSSFTWMQSFDDNSGFYTWSFLYALGRYCEVSVWWPEPWRWWTTKPLVSSTCWGGPCRNVSNFSCSGREAWNRSPSSTSRKSYFHWKSWSTTLLQLWMGILWIRNIYVFSMAKKRITIPGLTWCRSRQRSSLSPRQGQGLGQGGAGPAPGSPGRAWTTSLWRQWRVAPACLFQPRGYNGYYGGTRTLW